MSLRYMSLPWKNTKPDKFLSDALPKPKENGDLTTRVDATVQWVAVDRGSTQAGDPSIVTLEV